MNKLRTALAILVFATAASTGSYAQVTQTFISTSGSDGNNCDTTVSPCKTIQAALLKTASGGEINFVDENESSNCAYGVVKITKSVTVNGGASGGLVSCNDGGTILIAAGASDVVVLRNLNLHAFQGALVGVHFLTGGKLRVENLRIDGYQTGIEMQAAGRMTVQDTTIGSDPTTSSTGIQIQPVGGLAYADLENVHIFNGRFGMVASDGSRVSVKKSDFSLGTSNSSAGIDAEDLGYGLGTEVAVESSVISHFTIGLLVKNAKAVIRLKNSVLMGNPSGVYSAGGGVVQSFGDNRIVGSMAVGPLTAKTTK